MSVTLADFPYDTNSVLAMHFAARERMRQFMALSPPLQDGDTITIATNCEPPEAFPLQQMIYREAAEEWGFPRSAINVVWE